MNSFIAWVGGKKALRNEIVALLPPERESYVEVFGGGAWVLFHKQIEKNEVYNDYNGNLSNLFHCVKNRTTALLQELGFLPLCGRDEFFVLKKFVEQEEFTDQYLKEELELIERHLPPPQAEELTLLYQRSREDTEIRKAAAFFKVIRYSYACSCTSYACKGMDIRKFFHLIWRAAYRLKNTSIENQDFGVLIKHYDNPTAFFYIDPPYYEAEDYAVPFPKTDHQRLHDILMNTEGRWLLSYNDHPVVRELYEHHENVYMLELERPDSIALRYNAGQKYKELLIANFDIVSQNWLPEQLELVGSDGSLL